MAVHSYLSPKCEARKTSSIDRMGVFAREDIASGEQLVIWQGAILSTEEVESLPTDDYALQLHEDFYVMPNTGEDPDDAAFVNHSCSPNAGVKGQVILVARRAIQRDEEICFDYETTDSKGMNFRCHCGSADCRGTITGDAWMDQAFQKKNEGFFSWYLQEKIDAYNKELEKTFLAAARLHRSIKHKTMHRQREQCIFCEMEAERGIATI